MSRPLLSIALKRREYIHSVPEWAKSATAVQEFLLRSFPRLRKSALQRARAAKWNRIVHLYYMMGYTRGQIAVEMNLSYSNVHTTLRNIRRAALGLRTDGKKRQK